MAEPEPTREPTLQPSPSGFERKANHALGRTASALTSLVAVFLIGIVGVAMVALVVAVAGPLARHELSRAAVDGLDAAFLVIILLELAHTTLSRGPIPQRLQEFLIVAITASVRSGLEIAARHGKEEGDMHGAVLDLALNALGVLALVVALWIARRMDAHRRRERTQHRER
jgi:hypothetical protein